MNFEVTRLLLTTAEGEPIAYRHYRVADDPAGLVILLPGVHYGADGPLLFYPAVALREGGGGSGVFVRAPPPPPPPPPRCFFPPPPRGPFSPPLSPPAPLNRPKSSS